ncbi:hypothetical protein RchiOBHm_Chr5g0029761 [Rosa chinensis]|uniref:Uncharacterized protein n=1 Tax=Rosa chinensis TaxID=74649 RepID=A0A2P6Q9Q7_ROSCH|nr:hypothetical protein RchiOBHm_Chr5g0029761 [Rosa chinensis]
MSKRHADGSLPIEDFNIVLGNQSGKKVQMGSETDQRYDLIRGNHDEPDVTYQCKATD